MSMTETPTAAPTKRKYTRRKKHAAPAAKPKPVAEFSGLTANECCSDCNADGCVISGRPYCAHPFKGGLQGRDMANDAAISRLNSAKKMLGKAKVKVGEI